MAGERVGSVTVQAAAVALRPIALRRRRPLLDGRFARPGAVDDRVDLLRTVGGGPGRPLRAASRCCSSSTTRTCSTTPRPRSSTRSPRRGRHRPRHRAVGRAGPRPGGRPVEGRAGRADRGRPPSTPEAVEELLAAVLEGRSTRRGRGAVRRAEPGQRPVPARAGDRGARRRQPAPTRAGIWRLGEDLALLALVEIVEARLGHLDEPSAAARARRVRRAAGPGRAGGAVRPGARRGARAAGPAGQPPGRPPPLVHLAHPLYGDVVAPARRPCAPAPSPPRWPTPSSGPAPSRDEDVLRVATWRLTAGEGDPDVLLEGADHRPLALRLPARRAAGPGRRRRRRRVRRRPAGGRAPASRAGRDEAEAELAALEDRRRRRPGAAARRGRPLRQRGRVVRPWTTAILDQAGGAVADPEWRDALEARRLVVLLNAGPTGGRGRRGPLVERARARPSPSPAWSAPTAWPGSAASRRSR